MRRRAGGIVLAVAAMVSAPRASAQAPSSTEEREVLAVVQRMFDGMRTKDSALMRSAFDPSARLLGMRPGPGGGPPVVQVLTGDAFVNAMFNDRRGPWIERAWEPQVRISGTLATVWADYDFHFGTAFSHCGVDAVQLLKTAAGWKIVSIADTYVKEGCPSRPVPTP
jgi:hypothetical protein